MKPLYALIGRAARVLDSLEPSHKVLIVVVLIGLNLWAHWRIVKRAGYPGCWSLMMLVPCVNILFLIGFAWSRWPVQGARK